MSRWLTTVQLGASGFRLASAFRGSDHPRFARARPSVQLRVPHWFGGDARRNDARVSLRSAVRDNLPFWQSRLPKTFTIESGWQTDDAATLTIRGAVASGPPRIMFHLERVA